jgi:ketosteroid isomerase-like protein
MSIKLACLLAIAWFAGVGIAPVALATESADRAAIEAAAQAWTKAFNARDTNALLAVASDDLVLLDGSSAPMSGPRARDAWKKALGSGQGQLTNVSKEIVIAGDVAWRIAALKDAARQGQALEIWKRVGGEWKIQRQMSSNLLNPSNLLPTPTEPVLDRPAN